jgi:hypothetical protein
LKPKEFWRLHPIEFWWIADFYKSRRMYGKMTEKEVEEIYRKAYGPPPSVQVH